MKSASKLDAHAERLDDWFSEGKTYAWVKAQLLQDGCSVSIGRLSQWWQKRQAEKDEKDVLQLIATGAQQIKGVKAEFGKNPAPQLAEIIALHQTLIFLLSTRAKTDPKLLGKVTQMMKPLMAFAKLEQGARALEFEQTKFKEAMRSKVEAGLDAIAEEFKANPEAMRFYQQAREMIAKETK